MSSYNSDDALDLSRLGISKFYFYVAWLLTSLVIIVVAYCAGTQERALERAVGAVVFMTGIAMFPYIRGYTRQCAIRRAVKQQSSHQRQQTRLIRVRQRVWYVVKLLATVLAMGGLSWYMFDYMGIEALPAWQTALMMLAYFYLGGSLVREFVSGNTLLFGSGRDEDSVPPSKGRY